MEGRHGPILAVCWSPDGRRLAGANWKDTVNIWDPETGRQTATLVGHTGIVWTVSWSPDGRRLASGGADTTIKLWDADTGTEMATLRGHTWRIETGRLESERTPTRQRRDRRDDQAVGYG